MPLSLVGRDSSEHFYGAQVARFGGPVLVLGSADGSLAFSLVAKSRQIVGVEPSGFLMAEAEAKKAEQPAAQVELISSDLRSLRLDRRFKVVIAPKSALSLQPGVEALDAVLATVTCHLERDGAFLFEVAGLSGSSSIEGPHGRSLFTAHLRERRGAASIRRVRRQTLTAAELEGALAASGLEARERYGDFDGRPWDEGEDRQIVVAGLA
ncbi:MAG: class I SAM-dependent methyltransferase [Myxococcaceae bacterium]|nr:class I SAM-dependent methyltransferase [Myxococcaceae bacterium]